MNSLVDIRNMLPTVRVPALVLHRRGDQDSRLEEGRYVADRLPMSRFVELAGGDHFVAVNPDQILDEVETYLREAAAHVADRRYALAAILAGLDASSLDDLRADDGRLRGAATGRPGRTVSRETVVLFDGPATAVRAGLALLGSATGSGLGLHVAEVSTSDDLVVGAGCAVAAALAAAAPRGELWLTSVVKDLLAGSGVAVESRGALTLVDGQVQPVYRAVPH
jgi:hypothetical protein